MLKLISILGLVVMIGAIGEAEVPGICRICESHETNGSVPVLIKDYTDDTE
jgi:hypothetical protein